MLQKEHENLHEINLEWRINDSFDLCFNFVLKNLSQANQRYFLAHVFMDENEFEKKFGQENKSLLGKNYTDQVCDELLKVFILI